MCQEMRNKICVVVRNILSILCAACLVQATGEADVMPAVDMKEEEVNKPYCSAVHLRGWSSALDGECFEV